MTNPLRKERIEDEQLTTDDIARGGQPKGPETAKPIRSEGAGATSAPEKRKITSMSEREAPAFPQSARGPELGTAPSVKEAASRPAKEDKASTEDLRVALQRDRAFFHGLLAV